MRRRTRRFSKAKHDYVWTTSISAWANTEDTQAIPMLSSGFWEANANNFERATLVRVRAQWGFNQNSAAATAATAFIAVVLLTDLSFTVGDFDPGASGDYDTHDVLWVWAGILGDNSIGQNLTSASNIEIDIKAKRRLTSANQLVFVTKMATDPTGSPEVGNILISRTLVDRI